MRNKYSTDGDITRIHVKRKNGDLCDILIDTDDLEFRKNNYGSWSIYYNHGNYYARCTFLEDGKPVRKSMHRLIMKGEKGIGIIDHINRNSLDNRKCNLRWATASENQRNSIVSRGTNKSGYRGVTWHEPSKTWRVRVKVGKKMVIAKRVKNIEDAVKMAKDYHKTLYGVG